jgi:hypothetical protein
MTTHPPYTDEYENALKKYPIIIISTAATPTKITNSFVLTAFLRVLLQKYLYYVNHISFA